MSGLRYAARLPHSVSKVEVNEWCTETFGPSAGLTSNSRWFMLYYTIQFNEEKDRNWFILRWG
jgi:hypothetical protein